MTRIVDSKAALRAALAPARRRGESIGFVPTMGSLHAGHRSLVERARAECDLVVASIFVNPTQFDRSEDLAAYPRDLEGDRAILAEAGCDWLFTTSPEAMYPAGFDSWVEVGGGLDEHLCGATRPGHFRGVTTVVAKLFHIVGPDRAYFGEKDFQQLAIIEQMCRDLDFPLEVIPCPTVREPDGLALSSRNRLLPPEARARAIALPQSLSAAARAYAAGQREAASVLGALRKSLESAGGRIDYAEAVDARSLAPREQLNDHTVLALAVFFGEVRLIDNHRLARPFPEVR